MTAKKPKSVAPSTTASDAAFAKLFLTDPAEVGNEYSRIKAQQEEIGNNVKETDQFMGRCLCYSRARKAH
jgi:hypothetical protein